MSRRHAEALLLALIASAVWFGCGWFGWGILFRWLAPKMVKPVPVLTDFGFWWLVSLSTLNGFVKGYGEGLKL